MRDCVKSLRGGVGAVLLACCCVAYGAGSDPSLRTYAIQPACFPYMFMSVASRTADGAILSFNQVNGQTHFVRLGGVLGDYEVTAFEPGTERVFNPTINAYQERERGTVTLAAADGTRVVLTQGEPLAQPGWMATLVSLDTGGWQHVLSNDRFDIGSGPATVTSVSEEAVSVSAVGGTDTVTVAALTGEEQDQLAALWETRREQAATRAREAREAREERERELAKPVRSYSPPRQRTVVEIRSAPRHFYGTEYRYPTAFQVVPIAVRDASGRLVPRPLVVPQRFTTWRGGFAPVCR